MKRLKRNKCRGHPYKNLLNVYKYLMFSKSVVIIWERCLTVNVSHFNLQLVVDKDEEQKGVVST